MTHHAISTDAAVQQLVQFFEQLQPQDVTRLSALYAPDARFKDPFNDVQGLPAIEAIFVHMFASLDSPHFIVKDRLVQNEQCFLTWEFKFKFKSHRPQDWQTIWGATHVVFDPQGRVSLHRDYWDAAEELYEKLPFIGGLMRWLKRKVKS